VPQDQPLSGEIEQRYPPRAPRESEGPMLPADLDPRSLDREVREQLRPLARGVAEQVSLRLVAAGELIDEEPETALAHTLVARRLASRIPAVREAVGLAAYHAGQWQTAIGELRAYHRMSGQLTHVAVLADCERALGRPERAIDMYRATDRDQLAPDEAVELLIVAAGARSDLGQHEAAVTMLQVRELTAEEPWVARLRYAYADALLTLGRAAEAREWFARAAEVDEDATTDAAERLLDLDGVVLDDHDVEEFEDDGSDVDEGARPDANEHDTDREDAFLSDVDDSVGDGSDEYVRGEDGDEGDDWDADDFDEDEDEDIDEAEDEDIDEAEDEDVDEAEAEDEDEDEDDEDEDDEDEEEDEDDEEDDDERGQVRDSRGGGNARPDEGGTAAESANESAAGDDDPRPAL
jgi:tetratricopeptide (TPR) repeat protein